MIPGSNILFDALCVIGGVPVSYFSFLSETPNAGGVDVTTYNAAMVISNGTVQAVDRQNYEALGLDFSKRYISWYVPLNAIDLARDISGDVIEVLGRRWQLKGSEDWFGIDGWKELLAIDIGPATGNTTNA